MPMGFNSYYNHKAARNYNNICFRRDRAHITVHSQVCYAIKTVTENEDMSILLAIPKFITIVGFLKAIHNIQTINIELTT